MNKKFLCIALSVIMILVMPLAAYAAEDLDLKDKVLTMLAPSGNDPGPSGNDPDPTGKEPDPKDKPAEDDIVPIHNVPVSAVSIDKTKLTIAAKKTTTLKATVKPTDATDKNLDWISSKPSVAKVKDGKVTALKVGTAVICAKAKDGSNISKSCTVTVTKPVVKIKLNHKSATLKVKKTLKLKPTITPKKGSYKCVTWKSSNPKVAKVNSKGKVTALKKGKAVITCTANDFTKKKVRCVITVK